MSPSDIRLLLWVRALRAFGDGYVSLLLPFYLLTLGFDSLQVGAIATGTLLGSGLLTLLVGFLAHRFRRRKLLMMAAGLMIMTGAGFTFITDFWPLLLIAFVGTLNPSSGDVSVFLPLEHTLLSQAADDRHRTALFAKYSLIGSLVGALGALAAGLPDILASTASSSLKAALQGMFLVYGLLGVITLLIYRKLSPQIEPKDAAPAAPLGKSRKIVYLLTALFSLDAFAGGFVIQSLLALWLFKRFELSIAAAGTIFFWAGLFSAFSYLVAVRVAKRIGLVNTMVFTHLPANIFLLLVPFMPTLPLVIALLLARSALSQMDVPTRTSYVMAVVSPAERPAAASLTAVPRSLATATSPLLAGYLLHLSIFGWPLIIAGGLKIVYDLALLRLFSRIRPPEEAQG
ncbi:MAG TPA: MFS transporter [Acidiferrobacterales bacterium]|nr:MFS transporter [Acidiferrobacterales bacterium]